MGVLDFLSKEAGQARRRALDEFGRDIGYYVPPELRGLLGFIAEATPTATIDRAAQASNRVFAPDRTVGQRVGDLGAMLSETAGVVAPAMVASRAAMPAAQALQESLLGVSVGGKMAGQEALLRANQRGPMPDRLGVFAGSNALTADKAALKTAQNMADAGASRDEIWRDTGWFQGVDGKWRFEIDDRSIGLRSRAEAEQIGQNMRDEAKSLLDGIKKRNADLKIQPDLFPAELRAAHGGIRRQAKALKDEAGSNFGPEWSHETLGQRADYALTGNLAENYPSVSRDTIVRTQQYLDDAQGSFDPKSQSLSVARGMDAASERSTVLHELQHAIQGNEGFARGSNPSEHYPEDFINKIQELDGLEDSLLGQSWRAASPEERARLRAASEAAGLEKRQLRDAMAKWQFDQYRHTAGEVESRNVQARMDMTPEQRRANPPWTTQDVPDADQIVNFDRAGNQLGVPSQPLPTPTNEAEAMAKRVLEMRAAGRAGDVTEEMMAATDPQYMFANTPLPMDEASRMARAQEMGFDTGTPLYHGTGADFQAFDLSNFGQTDEGWFGRGVYSSGQVSGDFDANLYAPRDGGSVMPVIYADQSPIEFSAYPPRWLNGDAANATAEAQSRGFDGVRFFSEGYEEPVSEAVTFDPANIRSRFARFDPEFRHLRNLSAGVGGLGALGLLSMQPDRAQTEQETRQYLGGLL